MNRVLIVAGILNLIATLLHLGVGFYDPISPMLQSTMPKTSITTILVIWIMVTFLMFASSFWLIYLGFMCRNDTTFTPFIGWSYVVFGIMFLVADSVSGNFATPKWIVLLPVGFLSLYSRYMHKHATIGS
jgi:hypothetical protein